jgi:hypothetical protein
MKTKIYKCTSTEFSLATAEGDIWIAADRDDDGCTMGTWSVSRGWVAGTTGEIDDLKDDRLNGLTLRAAIRAARGIERKGQS